MSVLYLVAIILGCAAQNALKKPYTQKNNGKGVYLYGALTAAFAVLFFIVTCKDFCWDSGLIPYSVLFAVSYSASVAFSLVALACGFSFTDGACSDLFASSANLLRHYFS